MKNPSDPIGNWTHGLPACSAVPQSTALLCKPPHTLITKYKFAVGFKLHCTYNLKKTTYLYEKLISTDIHSLTLTLLIKLLTSGSKLIIPTDVWMYVHCTLGFLAGALNQVVMFAFYPWSWQKYKTQQFMDLIKHYTPWRYKWHGHLAPQIVNLDTRGRLIIYIMS